ncbi:hypothetical protein IJ182_06140 [bacterium]|nr:hypothetical protein [bacterium]
MNINFIKNNIVFGTNELNNKAKNYCFGRNRLAKDTLELSTKDITTEKVSSLPECPKIDAIKQSQYYNTYNYIPAGTKILDGFLDPGGNGTISDDGNAFSPREVIYINRKEDKTLTKMINDFTGFATLANEEKRANFLKTIVQYLSNETDENILKNCDNLPENEKILLGDVIDRNAAVCRHQALLYKIIGDEGGLNVSVVRGVMDNGRHAWNVVYLDNGKKLLIDTTNGIKQDITDLPEDGEIIYIDKNNEEHKYEPFK